MELNHAVINLLADAVSRTTIEETETALRDVYRILYQLGECPAFSSDEQAIMMTAADFLEMRSTEAGLELF